MVGPDLPKLAVCMPPSQASNWSVMLLWLPTQEQGAAYHAAPPRPSPFDAALTADLARWSLLEAVRWRLAASWAWGPCRARRFFFRDALSPIFFGGILTTTRLPPLH